MKRNGKLKRMLSLILMLCIVSVSLPMSVSTAEESELPVGYDDAGGVDQTLAAAEMAEKAGQGIVEIESLREENSKHFQIGDGTYQAVAYMDAVHRMGPDGKWRDIDNRLYSDNESGRYKTEDGTFSFARALPSEYLYIADYGEYGISFGLVPDEVGQTTAEVKNHEDRIEAVKALKGEEKLEALKNVDNITTVRYPSVYDGIDLECVISSNNVKENLILTQPTGRNTFKYQMKLTGLYAELSENGSVVLKDENGEGVYAIQAPYMYDAKGEESWNVAYTLEENGDVYIVTVTADSEWLSSPERAYPVTVDPMTQKNVTSDTYIYSSNPDTNYTSSNHLWVSVNSNGADNRISYAQASMPTLPDYAKVTNATLKLKYFYYVTTGSMEIGLYRAMRYWKHDTLTWNVANAWANKGLATERTASAIAGANPNASGDSSAQWLTFSITPLVKQWYAGATNYGFGLKCDSGPNTSVVVCSRENGTSYAARYEITYTEITPIIENGTYFLKNKKTGKYADIENQIMADGTNICQWDLHAEDSQRWIFTYSHSENYYTIKSANSTSSYYLGVENDSTSNNANIVLRRGLNTNSIRTITDGMLWTITATTGSANKLTAVTGETSGRVLAVGPTSGGTNGINLVQYSYVNNENHHDEWYLIRMLPTNGYEITYNALAWAGVPSMNCNCYAYAINNQVQEPTGNQIWYKQQPGAYYNTHCGNASHIPQAYQYPPSLIVAAVTKDFDMYNTVNGAAVTFTPVGRYEICPAGTYKVALVISSDDYHWYRQDSDGLWSHKRGTYPVKRTDEAGDLIIDPYIANRDSYTTFVGYYAVKPWNNMYDSTSGIGN